MMAGLLTIDEGTLHVLGHDVASEPQAVQDRISYMPQRFGLYEDLSVQENLDLYADLHGVPPDVRRERFASMLEMTDLARFTDRPCRQALRRHEAEAWPRLHAGALAGPAAARRTDVGVDPLSRRDLWKIVQQLVRGGNLSVVVSTAYMDEAERCAQVFVLQQGRLLAKARRMHCASARAA
jgi:ABC-2 type transport system ATP-binding protein